MAKQTLIVTKSRKDSSGNIIGVCGSGWAHDAKTAIANIRKKTHEYRVLRANGPYVRPYGEGFLRSDGDKKANNNLASLPDC